MVLWKVLNETNLPLHTLVASPVEPLVYIQCQTVPNDLFVVIDTAAYLTRGIL